jgi:hypothetical protein
MMIDDLTAKTTAKQRNGSAQQEDGSVMLGADNQQGVRHNVSIKVEGGGLKSCQNGEHLARHQLSSLSSQTRTAQPTYIATSVRHKSNET